jgi:hypothetical protein
MSAGALRHTGTESKSVPEPASARGERTPLTNVMELAGLEPATSWVRCGAASIKVSARIRLYRGASARAASAATIAR